MHAKSELWGDNLSTQLLHCVHEISGSLSGGGGDGWGGGWWVEGHIVAVPQYAAENSWTSIIRTENGARGYILAGPSRRHLFYAYYSGRKILARIPTFEELLGQCNRKNWWFKYSTIMSVLELSQVHNRHNDKNLFNDLHVRLQVHGGKKLFLTLGIICSS